MPTATVHIAEVGGYAGPTRCYRLSTPVTLGGKASEYVSICVTPTSGTVAAEVRVYPAGPTGAAAGMVLAKRAGSFALHDDYTPGDVAYEDGVRRLALGLLGGYEVIA